MSDQATADKLDELQSRVLALRTLVAALLATTAAERPDADEFLTSLADAISNTADNLPVWPKWREHYKDEVQSTIAMARTFTPK
ncbi:MULTISPECIES: hypothetical protein [Burkholderia]|uniref:hypothetical protein n=1 Tax=Burkholderia TaxID=32008 RepID=UPI000F7B4811|nr:MULTISPECIES: hypothetical protein [Burkholderia]EKS9912822.1 hypothetical protein [Burkholderia multivorans]MBN6729441.1 hypothetical protein [Burkholderia multivorans]MBN8164820.1 hypothetical protein [Burkholderia multivorans]MBN8167780.1 hypothetical protein [Burkholderia multivorans]MBN8175623.1 hypothetical protein [Burkholderia multivorans]